LWNSIAAFQPVITIVKLQFRGGAGGPAG